MTQFIRTCHITRCSSRRRMWPSQFHRLSLACVTMSGVCLWASSAILRPVILDSIFDAVPFTLRRSCTDSFQASHPYRRVDMTNTSRCVLLKLFSSVSKWSCSACPNHCSISVELHGGKRPHAHLSSCRQWRNLQRVLQGPALEAGTAIFLPFRSASESTQTARRRTPSTSIDVF